MKGRARPSRVCSLAGPGHARLEGEGASAMGGGVGLVEGGGVGLAEGWGGGEAGFDCLGSLIVNLEGAGTSEANTKLYLGRFYYYYYYYYYF